MKETRQSRNNKAIKTVAAPENLSPHAFVFVRREETVDGRVARTLAEIRPSIQIQTRDPLWLREPEAGSLWRKTPRIALWAPRYRWRYGYLERNVRAFAVGLTPLGFNAIVGGKVGPYVGGVFDLADFAPDLARALNPGRSESFEDWKTRIAGPLAAYFADAPHKADLGPALRLLATSDGGAVAAAARAAGVSERHFRRIFSDFFGVAPKRYQRALRVDRLIRQLHPAPWETDAHAEPIAFSDQPHAIREFREMTGMTPADYVAAKRIGDQTMRSIAIDDVEPPSDDDARAAVRY